MSNHHNPLLHELQSRQLIAQSTALPALTEHLNAQPRVLYCGFDPTADSLHLGHLVPLLTLRRFQQAGHKPIALVGGATGLIGDPSFKAAERQLHTPDTVAGWADAIRQQVSPFLDFDSGNHAAIVANNLDWLGNLPMLAFLRDVGKHFAINAMVNKESVRQRLQREGAGMSFTEFAYALLQAMDFAELNRRYHCTVQVGGSDQWGNIVEGIDLTRRHHQAQVFGLTVPLVTKADGSKFGKTEAGTVWLDPKKTSPYAFYQFWLNTADADVYRYLRFFTFLSVDAIQAIERADAEKTGRKSAQGILAKAVTQQVHGNDGLASAERITQALFAGNLQHLAEQDIAQLQLDGLPTTLLHRSALTGQAMTQLLTAVGMAKSGKQVKDALHSKAVSCNGIAYGMADNQHLATCFAMDKALYGRFFLVTLGKKNHHLFEVV